MNFPASLFAIPFSHNKILILVSAQIVNKQCERNNRITLHGGDATVGQQQQIGANLELNRIWFSISQTALRFSLNEFHTRNHSDENECLGMLAGL